MAAAHNYLNDNPGNSQDRVVAFFRNRDDAYRALSRLKDAGFETHTMGLAVGRDQEGISGTSTSATDRDDTSFWQRVKDFFSGESDESEHHVDLRDAGVEWGWSDERYGYYEEGIASGGAVVTVTEIASTKPDASSRKAAAICGILDSSPALQLATPLLPRTLQTWLPTVAIWRISASAAFSFVAKCFVPTKTGFRRVKSACVKKS